MKNEYDLAAVKEDFSVGLTLNFSLFDGGLKKAKVGEALAQKRQMDSNTLLVTAERQLSDADYTYQLAILKLNQAYMK